MLLQMSEVARLDDLLKSSSILNVSFFLLSLGGAW